MLQKTHAGIHHRIPGLTGTPRLKQLGAEFVFPQPVKGSIDITKLNRRFIFQFLNEVTPPCQPGFKAGERLKPRGIDAPAILLFLSQTHQCLTSGLYGLTHRKTAECQVGTDATARFRRRQRTGHLAAIIAAASLQKRLKPRCRPDSPTRLRRLQFLLGQTSLLSQQESF